MNRISKRSYIMYIFALAFFVGLFILFFTMESNSTKWVTKDYNKHLYSDGELLSAGTITDRNGVVLAETVDGERKFNDDADIRKATLHVVGDTYGYIATGVHTSMKSELTGYSLLNGVYNLKKNGAGNDIQLSIDAELCVTAMEAMGSYQGTVGVYNYKTGEILCAVSLPTYDVYNKPTDILTDDTGKYEGIYLNRYFSGVYTPGSTFKIITACCALENIEDIEERTWTCEGAWTNSVGNSVTCNDVHGTLDFESALSHSCNTVFASLAAELGNEKMQATAEEFGFNQRFTVDGTINLAKSTFDLSEAYDIDRAWSGIGQYTTLVNPCHATMYIGAIANETGIAKSPTILLGGKTKNIDFIGEKQAEKLNEMLRNNVENYYGDDRFPNLQMCGKTGTAQVADEEPHTWFLGYSQRSDLPLAIVVVCENSGNYGINVAIPIANAVMQKAYETYVVGNSGNLEE